MTHSKLAEISVAIGNEVRKMHEDRKTWNKVCGQWLVYGFERSLGFGGSVTLCGVVESAYKAKKCIDKAVYECIKGLYVENGQWEE